MFEINCLDVFKLFFFVFFYCLCFLNLFCSSFSFFPWRGAGQGPKPRKSGGPKGGALKGGALKGGGPQGGGPNGGEPKNDFAFFPSPAQNSFFSSLSGGLLVEFWWCV